MKRMTKGGLAALGVLSLAAFLVQPARADDQAQPNDIVGVGSDTVQYVADFVADGDINGHAGGNAANPGRRIFNFDASTDYYGRGSYKSGSTTPTVPGIGMRAGAKPVNRPNGSGAGITAINADNGSPETINYTRSSRLPTCVENGTSVTNGKGGLHVIQIATDELEVGVASTTNAPAALSAVDLANIYDGTYTKWSDVPGYSGPAPTASIHPFIPQSGSGTRNFFLADLLAAKPSFTLLPSIPVSEEHDPTPLLGDANAIAPFSKGRLTLLNSAYFSNSGYVAGSVVLLGGSGAYDVTRGLYVILRQTDYNATTPVWQVGGTKTWAQQLFIGTTSTFGRSSASALYTSAGVTQAYQDLGAPGVSGTSCT